MSQVARVLLLVVGIAELCIRSYGWVHSSNFFQSTRRSPRLYAEVDLVWPNGKKSKAAGGSTLKEAAAKAGFKPNYGCEEGKCGSCELLANGKKIRPCTGKVPSSTGPVTLKNP